MYKIQIGFWQRLNMRRELKRKLKITGDELDRQIESFVKMNPQLKNYPPLWAYYHRKIKPLKKDK